MLVYKEKENEMKFIDLNDLAESLAEYIDDMQLKSQDIIIANNKDNIINLTDWLIQTNTESIKMEYTSNYIKLSLS